jgi:glycosyltransferase involved in cell wall biosynthesis
MRVTILSPYFPPEMGAPPARLYEIAVRLKSYGHEMTVVTAFPNRPHGRIYEGYRRKFRMIEDMDGIRVIRTWIRPSASSASFFGRTFNDLSFTWSSGWSTAGLLGQQDVLLVQNPPLFSGFSANHLRKKTGAKMVMWCGDIWPDVLLQSGEIKPGLMANIMRRLQRYCFRHSDLVAVTNPRVAQDTQEAYDCKAVTVWSNGVDTSLFRPDLRDKELRREFGAGDDDLLVGYIGLHGRFQGLDAIIEAADRLKERKNIKFIFIGEGVEKPRLQDMAQNKKLENIIFHSYKPKAEIPAILASCDVSAITLLSRMPGTMPSKFYEALAAGAIPVVAEECEAGVLARKYNIGKTYEPMDGESFANAIREIADMSPKQLQDMRDNGRGLSMRFDRDKLAEFVNETIQALVAGQSLPEVDW